MNKAGNTYVIIPALNEEASIGKVLNELPSNLVTEVIVSDNGSTDKTAEVAKTAGATVIQSQRGYGSACLAGLEYLNSKADANTVVAFLDGDYSDYPAELSLLIEKLNEGHDMVIGSRVISAKKSGGLTPQQVFGNRLACFLLKLIYSVNYTDLGPFRVIKWTKLQSLEMKDLNYGWTVEMQIKAAKKKLQTTEIPVSYRDRIGESKVSGTLKGTILAGYKIIYTLFKYI